jgi:predicted SAM-dependent methyltransferase
MTLTHKAWIDKRTRWCSSDASFLEIGSMDVNGAPARRTSQYIGIDMRPGKGVDIVANGHALPFGDESFDFVICAETLEHDSAPWLTSKEIYRVTKTGGSIIVTVPGIGFPRHDYPSDYWRFTEDGLAILFSDFQIIECVPDYLEHAVRLFAKKN